jgi:hypothetical protein
MLTYSSDQLRVMNNAHPPPRAARKKLFTFRLWRPARYRYYCQPTICEPVIVEATAGARPISTSWPLKGRSTDRPITIGWLNAQSIQNKTDVISETITDRSLDVFFVN